MVFLAVTTLIQVGISLALGAAAMVVGGLLMRRGRGQRPEEQITEVARRGTWVPRVIGRVRLSGIFGWAGNRRVVTQRVGGKGGLLGGASGESYTYYERGVHWLCVGPASALSRIWENDAVAVEFDPTLTPTTHPSGTYVETTIGNFWIYWGDCPANPINERLGDPNRMNIASRWPFVCYVEWDEKLLGSSSTWPLLEYEVEVRPLTNGTIGSSTLEPWIEATSPTTQDSDFGGNPAFVLWELLTAPPPHGCGIDADDLDAGSFAALADLCVDEHLPITLIIRQGDVAAQIIARILDEVGCTLVQAGEVLAVVPVREPGGLIPELTDDAVAEVEPRTEQRHAEANPTRYVFAFADRDNQYQDNTVLVANDADARTIESARPQVVRLETIGDRWTAAAVASRMAGDRDAQVEAISLEAMRGGRRLLPGQVFQLADTVYRTAVVEPAFDRRSAVVEAILDQFGRADRAVEPPGSNGGDVAEAAPDPVVRVLQVPEDLLTGAGPEIVVLRVRANQSIVAAQVHISANGTSYLLAGSQDVAAAGGTLNRPFPDDDTSEPSITAYNADIENLPDLTGNDPAFDAGELLCLIGSELMRIRKVEAVDGGWRLSGLARAQYGTLNADHETNDPVLIFRRSDLTPFSGGIIQVGETISVKTQPRTIRSVVSLADVTASDVTIV